MNNAHPTYQETLTYLFEKLPMYQRQGPSAYKKDLTNITALCEALDHPQDKFNSVHIAGTNGKGTTAHLIACLLQTRGLKVGLYTSPHYVDFRERIKINGAFIPEETVVAFVHEHKELIEKVSPSFFEITAAMAFDYFAKEEVDIAIIETGLGGRLDSTNIINPDLCIITNISLDHQSMLGETLQEIAGEKAGIIKNKVPVVIGETQLEVKSVFTEKAKEMQAPIVLPTKIIGQS
jgi:dihydrofolate synthase / folylpolyglutamate synthase